jgi:hypothetical protein
VHYNALVGTGARKKQTTKALNHEAAQSINTNRCKLSGTYLPRVGDFAKKKKKNPCNSVQSIKSMFLIEKYKMSIILQTISLYILPPLATPVREKKFV